MPAFFHFEKLDKALFERINGLAGHSHWLDLLGRYTAVYGLLVIVLIVLGLVWWPRLASETRRRLLFGLLMSGVVCAILSGALWVLATHVLHNDLRARPFNSAWATPLITPETHDAFPAWPVLIACALLIPVWRVAPVSGRIVAAFTALLGFALVFTGANFPLDIFAGAAIGVVIGYTAMVASGLLATVRARRMAGIIWLLLVIGGLGAVLTAHAVKRSQHKAERALPAASIMVTPPPAVTFALQQTLPRSAADRLTFHLTAATNGHLTAAELQIVLPEEKTDITSLAELARRGVNAVYTKWPQLGLLTVSIGMEYGSGKAAHFGTLHTVTVARDEWPAGGFNAGLRLPGQKFYKAGLPSTQTGAPAGISPAH